ncbi:MAG: hypothetical protein ACKON7_12315, partial [Planctomycetaceae bacterium]
MASPDFPCRDRQRARPASASRRCRAAARSPGAIGRAAAAYATLEQGPPAFKVRAALAKAGALVAQQKYPEAEREY